MALAAALASHKDDFKQDINMFLPATPLVLPDLDLSESPPSSLSSSPKPPSLAISTSSSSSDRPNEHLAVLLPKHLWKPDNIAVHCDNFYCKVSFSFLERRHHCRKCGGVYCGACSSQTTPLLDSSKLNFLHPPRNHPVSEFESPKSPVLDSRVCDECWDQIWGARRPSTPRTPDASPVRDHPRPSLTRGFSSPGISAAPTTPHLKLNPLSTDRLPAFPASLSRKARRSSVASEPSPALQSSSSSDHLDDPSRRRRSVRTSLTTPIRVEKEPSYGALDAYPLRRRSLICKATGGGRWEPRNDPTIAGYRVPIPGFKMDYEVQMEEEERQEQEKVSGKVVIDGAFRYRFVCSQPGSPGS